MQLILLDSTSEITRFGYYDSDTNTFKKTESSGEKKSSDEVAKIFQTLLKNEKIDIENIDGFVCITGPGSFTGIRMGLAFIAGLTSGLKTKNQNIKTIPLTLFQAHLIENDENISKEKNISVQIKSNNSETIFVQDFNSTTLQAISSPRETLSSDFHTENQIINTNTYNIEIVLKYICENFEKYQSTENIIPCYIRRHYGVPKSYIVNESACNALKKLTISNEEKEIGFIEYQTDNITSEIVNFEILENYRSIGAGKFLLKIFIEKMQKNNIKKIILDVRLKNIIAQNLYKKFGFIQDGIRKNYYTTNEKDDAILMSLDIT
jgi:ribosomal-protein-alanine N-acetyltransferase